MGAEFDYYEHDNNPTTAQIKSRFKEECAERNEAYGHGDGYPGHMGQKYLSISSKVFDTYDEAYDYLDENADKWDDALAVAYKAKCKVPSKGLQRLLERVTKTENDITQFEKDVLRAKKSTKSATIGCKKCNARFQRSTLQHLNCTNCYKQNAFMSETDKKRLTAKKKAHTLTKKNAENAQCKTVNAMGVNYIVGGWCPS